ncbi:MAG: polyprenyl synthetase family protein [Vampirovibrionales bacterium]
MMTLDSSSSFLNTSTPPEKPSIIIQPHASSALQGVLLGQLVTQGPIPLWEKRVLPCMQQAILNIITPDVSKLADSLTHALQVRGKLLRPSMTILFTLLLLRENPAYQALSDEALVDKLEARHWDTAAISELIHIATLLHDDVLDQSDLRRHQVTVRAKWGNHQAILSGDYLLAQASIKLAQVGSIPLVERYSHVLAALCQGEVLQWDTQYSTAWDWDTYVKKTHYKTSSLFEAACEAAAILEAPEQRMALANLGRQFGWLFQLRDDVLDLTASEAEAGKPVLDDLRNGLVGIPVWMVLRSDDIPEYTKASLKQHIAHVFHYAQGSHETFPLLEESLQHVTELLEVHGAVDRTHTWMKEEVASLSANIHTLFPRSSLWREFLLQWVGLLLPLG